MATRKTGSRRIVVDGVAYRWRIRNRATPLQTGIGVCHGRLHMAVELANEPRSVLVVFTNRTHPRDIDTFPSDVTPVRPADVAGWVREAVAAGWAASEPGPQFHLRVDGAPAERHAGLPRPADG